MTRFLVRFTVAFFSLVSVVQSAKAQDGPYKIVATNKVGGDGGFDYVTADAVNRRLYIARSGTNGHLGIFDLDSLAPVGDIPNVSGHGAAIDTKYAHGFITSKPVMMFNTKTLAVIRTIDTTGNPDGSLVDTFDDHVDILSHSSPNVTVLDAKDGAVLGTIDLGGASEQAVSDHKGKIYVDLEDESSIAVVDTKQMTVAAKYDVSSHGGGCAGLALDIKNSVLFASCREKNNMIILSAKDGSVLADLPTGKGSDGTVFNPTTGEAFSSQGDGTLTIVKELHRGRSRLSRRSKHLSAQRL